MEQFPLQSALHPPLLPLYVAGIAWAQGLTHIIPTWIQSPDAIPPTNFDCDNIAGVNIISEIKFFVSALCLSLGGRYLCEWGNLFGIVLHTKHTFDYIPFA